MSDRTPPHDIVAEKSALGAVFIKPSVMAELDILAVDDFFLPVHREIFEAMRSLRERRRSIDYVMVADELKAKGTLGRLEGGETYLITLPNECPTAENALHYARLVREKGTLRRLIAACAEVASTAYGDVGEFGAFMTESVGKVAKFAMADISVASETLSHTADKIARDIERAERGETVSRIPTGIEALDELLGGGMALEYLVVPISLTSIGKSSWARQVAFRGAAERGIPALYFSLEDPREHAVAKAAANLARIDGDLFNPLRPGETAKPGRWKAIDGALAQVSALESLVQIEEHRHIGQIVAVSTAWRSKHPGPALIVVDHMQKVRGIRGKGISREQEVSGVSQTLKDLAKDLKLPIIAPAQLNDEARSEKRRPNIGDTRESKAIEHDADIVLAIHRKRQADSEECELGVVKHRGGKTGRRTVMWRGAWGGFETLGPKERTNWDEE